MRRGLGQRAHAVLGKRLTGTGDLTNFGLPGCALLQSCEALHMDLPTSNGSLSVQLALPAQQALLGARIFVQVAAPGASGPVGLAMSGAVEWVLGVR